MNTLKQKYAVALAAVSGGKTTVDEIHAFWNCIPVLSKKVSMLTVFDKVTKFIKVAELLKSSNINMTSLQEVGIEIGKGIEDIFTDKTVTNKYTAVVTFLNGTFANDNTCQRVLGCGISNEIITEIMTMLNEMDFFIQLVKMLVDNGEVDLIELFGAFKGDVNKVVSDAASLVEAPKSKLKPSIRGGKCLQQMWDLAG